MADAVALVEALARCDTWLSVFVELWDFCDANQHDVDSALSRAGLLAWAMPTPLHAADHVGLQPCCLDACRAAIDGAGRRDDLCVESARWLSFFGGRGRSVAEAAALCSVERLSASGRSWSPALRTSFGILVDEDSSAASGHGGELGMHVELLGSDEHRARERLDPRPTLAERQHLLVALAQGLVAFERERVGEPSLHLAALAPGALARRLARSNAGVLMYPLLPPPIEADDPWVVVRRHTDHARHERELERAFAVAADTGAGVLVLPELCCEPGDLPEIQARLDASPALGLVVVGLTHVADGAGAYLNEAVLLGWQRSDPLLRHRKLSPFRNGEGQSERLTVGTAIDMLHTPLGAVGVNICMDLLDDRVQRRMVTSPVAAVLVPSLSDSTGAHGHRVAVLAASGRAVFVANSWPVVAGHERTSASSMHRLPDGRGRAEAESADHWLLWPNGHAMVGQVSGVADRR